MTSEISVRQSGGVLDIEISRPDKKNALTTSMYTQLADAFDSASADPKVRVVVLHGSDTCFTAGNDLKDFLETPPADFDSPAFRFIKGVTVFEKPLVVAVEGPAVGIGTTILLHADLVAAGEGSTFILPFVNLGVCPEAASSYLLPRIMGHVRAAKWLLLSEAFGAEEAREAGLINDVVATGTATARAQEWATALAKKPPSALRLAKSLMRRGAASAVADAFEAEGKEFISRLESEEANEALNAFLEKRPPDFSPFS